MRRTRALAATLICLAAGCQAPTELMLIVKAAPGLTFGLGADIDSLHVQVQPADEPPLDFYYTRSLDLCPKEMAGSVDCRPQQYASPDYADALTLPVRFLLEPGDNGLDKEIRIWVDALKAGYAQPRLANGMRFKFSRGHRLWLELPLYRQCLDNLTCQATDQVCDKNKNCSSIEPTTSEPAPDGVDVDLAGLDLRGVDLAEFVAPPDLFVLDMQAPSPDLAFACGASNEPCCTPGLGCTGSLTCSGGFCVDTTILCGQLMQACCMAGPACIASGSMCNGSSICVTSCGANEQACCSSTPLCVAGQCFIDDPAAGTNTCHACGYTGARCCPGNQCGDRNNCVSGSCAMCGAAGQSPCTTGAQCDPKLVVDASGKCNSCGGTLDAGCCAGTPRPTCSPAPINVLSSLVCDANDPPAYPLPNYKCVPCGTMGQACCTDPGPQLPCTGTLSCGADGKCAPAPCGTAGIQCCGGVGGSCGSNLICTAAGQCSTQCGTTGLPCCPMGDMGLCVCGGTVMSLSLEGETWETFSLRPVSLQVIGTICL